MRTARQRGVGLSWRVIKTQNLDIVISSVINTELVSGSSQALAGKRGRGGRGSRGMETSRPTIGKEAIHCVKAMGVVMKGGETQRIF